MYLKLYNIYEITVGCKQNGGDSFFNRKLELKLELEKEREYVKKIIMSLTI